jgi:hypothetical protein
VLSLWGAGVKLIAAPVLKSAGKAVAGEAASSYASSTAVMNGIDAYQGEQSKNLGGDNLVASIKDPANLPFVGDVYVIGSKAYMFC